MRPDRGPYLFDVGVIAVGHADTPVSEESLSWIRRAVTGDIDAVVPRSAVFGAQIVLSEYYGFSNAAASRLMENFLDSERVHWYPEITEALAESALSTAGSTSVDAWDGYYAAVAEREGVGTVLTTDHDFRDIVGDDIDVHVVLDEADQRRLTAYLDGL
jgi:predicted nucleic acid-binding protein